MTKALIVSLFALFLGVFAEAASQPASSPLVIGHRGASGYRPEHTLESYRLAIKMGADFIEPDLVITKDKVLIARHENEISGTTDVAIKFPDRKTTKEVDGKKIEGWFAEDFTLKEIKTLRAKERLPQRDHNFDGQFEIPTLEEVIALAKKEKVGIYPEMKHPTFFKTQNLDLVPELIKILKKHKLNSMDSKIFVQSFELTALKEIKAAIPVKTIFLLDDPQINAFDTVVEGKPRTYLSYVSSPEAMKELSALVYGIGPYKRYLIPTDANGNLTKPTPILALAHQFGLKVHPYTFRSDKEYLAKEYNGDPKKEYIEFFKLGVDGLFSDFPDTAVAARKEFLNSLQK